MSMQTPGLNTSVFHAHGKPCFLNSPLKLKSFDGLGLGLRNISPFVHKPPLVISCNKTCEEKI